MRFLKLDWKPKDNQYIYNEGCFKLGWKPENENAEFKDAMGFEQRSDTKVSC